MQSPHGVRLDDVHSRRKNQPNVHNNNLEFKIEVEETPTDTFQQTVVLQARETNAPKRTIENRSPMLSTVSSSLPHSCKDNDTPAISVHDDDDKSEFLGRKARSLDLKEKSIATDTKCGYLLPTCSINANAAEDVAKKNYAVVLDPSLSTKSNDSNITIMKNDDNAAAAVAAAETKTGAKTGSTLPPLQDYLFTQNSSFATNTASDDDTTAATLARIYGITTQQLRNRYMDIINSNNVFHHSCSQCSMKTASAAAATTTTTSTLITTSSAANTLSKHDNSSNVNHRDDTTICPQQQQQQQQQQLNRSYRTEDATKDRKYTRRRSFELTSGV